MYGRDAEEGIPYFAIGFCGGSKIVLACAVCTKVLRCNQNNRIVKVRMLVWKNDFFAIIIVCASVFCERRKERKSIECVILRGTKRFMKILKS